MRSTLQKKIWKLSANSTFCLVFLSAGLLLLLIDAQFKLLCRIIKQLIFPAFRSVTELISIPLALADNSNLCHIKHL